MRIFRSFLITIMYLIFGIGSLVINFILFPILKHFCDRKKYAYICSDIIRNVWKFFIGIFVLVRLIKIDIKKLEKIENKIIVATHPSFIDILILMSIIPRTTCFVKESLYKNPILTNIISSIFLTNNMELEDLKSKTKEMLDLGFNIIIFPMGIRHMKNEHPKIRKGASLVALNSGTDVVPIRIWTNDKFLFINEPFYVVGRNRVTFTIEQDEDIKISDYTGENEIVTKREITKAIEKSLYKDTD